MKRIIEEVYNSGRSEASRWHLSRGAQKRSSDAILGGCCRELGTIEWTVSRTHAAT